MGILNVTLDSFYDGGKYAEEKSILLHAEKLISEGADIIDIGAYSTRPNAVEVTEEEELKRLIPSIRSVRKSFPDIIISADTFRSHVAEQAVNEGADIVNDVSGGTGFVNPSEAEEPHSMFETVGRLKVPYILMHANGTPQTMQQDPQYKDVTTEVVDHLYGQINHALSKGIMQIIVDPGFGFGKTTEHNYQLLDQLASLKKLGYPILVGMSRKGMIYKTLGIKAEEALNGTTAANTIALMNGANILRVHDIKEAKEALKIFTLAKKTTS